MISGDGGSVSVTLSLGDGSAYTVPMPIEVPAVICREAGPLDVQDMVEGGQHVGRRLHSGECQAKRVHVQVPELLIGVEEVLEPPADIRDGLVRAVLIFEFMVNTLAHGLPPLSLGLRHGFTFDAQVGQALRGQPPSRQESIGHVDVVSHGITSM